MREIYVEHGRKHWNYMNQHSANPRLQIYGRSPTAVPTADAVAKEEIMGY